MEELEQLAVGAVLPLQLPLPPMRGLSSRLSHARRVIDTVEAFARAGLASWSICRAPRPSPLTVIARC